MKIDDELQAQVQAFTSWAASKGYHVIGALIGPKNELMVRTFSTSPEGDFSKQLEHRKKLVDILYSIVHKGKSEEMMTLTLGTN